MMFHKRNCLLFYVIIITQYLFSLSLQQFELAAKSFVSVTVPNPTYEKSYWSKSSSWQSQILPKNNSDVIIDYDTYKYNFYDIILDLYNKHFNTTINKLFDILSEEI